MPASQGDEAYGASHRRLHGPQQTLRPRSSRSGDSSTLQRLPLPTDRSRPVYSMAHGRSSSRHLSSVCRRRLRDGMDTELWYSLDGHFRPRESILLGPLPTADEDMGHRGHHDNAVPSRGKRHGGTFPQTPQRSPNRVRRLRTRKMVLETSNGTFSHTDNNKAGCRSLAVGPRLR